jgi:predicted transcriptional regulator
MNRSGIELRGDVLRQIKNGVDTPTRISYSVNCNWQQLCFFLSEFVDQGLVECSAPIRVVGMRKMRRYRITPKGEEFLSYVIEVKRLVGVKKQDLVSPSEE